MATPNRTPSKKLVNDPSSCVTESIDGLILSNSAYKRLDGYPDVKVVVRSDYEAAVKNAGKVALISGGGSGHEPAHAGYVGKGGLTAAVCGEVFASPSVRAVLAAIRAVSGPAGCLLIVKNYTGDRLNFGLAAEQAKSEYNIKVDMVVVADDVAIDGHPQPRGVAGTVFVHKIAGALAESGGSLEDVTAIATKVAGSVGSMGASLTVGALPGQPHSDRLGDDEVEIGGGIHGEPGRSKVQITEANALVDRLVESVVAGKAFKRGSHVAVLVNNLGATAALEIPIVAGRAVHVLEVQHGIVVDRILTGFFMTSLDAAGVSISVLAATDDLLKLLDADSSMAAWPRGPALVNRAKPVPLPAEAPLGFERPQSPSEVGLLAEKCIRGAMAGVLAKEQVITELDEKIGDGDCGQTHSAGAKAVLDDVAKCYPLDDPVLLLRALGNSVSRSMAGSSGVLYLLFLTAGATAMQEHGAKGSFASWIAALDAGVAAMMRYGGAKAGDRTMLDALIPAVEKLKAMQGSSPAEAMEAAVQAARDGAESTRTMTAGAGRASYVPVDVLAATPDPGAIAVVAWMEGLLAAVKAP